MRKRDNRLFSYLCRLIQEIYVPFFNLQTTIQSQSETGPARRDDPVGADPRTGRRQRHGRPLRRRRPHAAGRHFVRRLGLLHPLHRRRRHRTGPHAPDRRTLRPGRPLQIVAIPAKRPDVLYSVGISGLRAPTGRHPFDVPHGTARRSGRYGHTVLQVAGLQHAVHHALLHLQAIPRRRRKHPGRNGRGDSLQPDERRLELDFHLRPPRIRRTGRHRCGARHPRIAHRHADHDYRLFLQKTEIPRLSSGILAPQLFGAKRSENCCTWGFRSRCRCSSKPRRSSAPAS